MVRTTLGNGDVRWWMHWRHQTSKALYGSERIGTRWIEWCVVK